MQDKLDVHHASKAHQIPNAVSFKYVLHLWGHVLLIHRPAILAVSDLSQTDKMFTQKARQTRVQHSMIEQVRPILLCPL